MAILKRLHLPRIYSIPGQYNLLERALNIAPAILGSVLVAVFLGNFMYSSSGFLQQLYLSLVSISIG